MAHPCLQTRDGEPFYNTHGPTLASNARQWVVLTQWHTNGPTLAPNVSWWAVLTQRDTHGPTLTASKCETVGPFYSASPTAHPPHISVLRLEMHLECQVCFFFFWFPPTNVTNSRCITSPMAHPQLTLYTSEDLAEPRSTKTAQTTQNALFEPFSKFYFILFVTNLFYIVYIGYNVQITREREWWKAVTTEMGPNDASGVVWVI